MISDRVSSVVLEKPTPEEAFSNVINAGLYILEPEVFDHVPVNEKFDFSKQLFPKLTGNGVAHVCTNHQRRLV